MVDDRRREAGGIVFARWELGRGDDGNLEGENSKGGCVGNEGEGDNGSCGRIRVVDCERGKLAMGGEWARSQGGRERDREGEGDGDRERLSGMGDGGRFGG